MAMKKSVPAANPDAYVTSLTGWQRPLVERLRRLVLTTARFDEVIKWRHLVYFNNGPVLLIRAEDHRVLFGFWRGKRLRDIEPALKGDGKYELATLELREGMDIADKTAKRLVREAVVLNETLGNPAVATPKPGPRPNRQPPARKKASARRAAAPAKQRHDSRKAR